MAQGNDAARPRFTPYIGSNKGDDLSLKSDWPHNKTEKEIKINEAEQKNEKKEETK